jgi:hypothetical protein
MVGGSGPNNIIIDFDVLVHEDIPEAHCASHLDCQFGSENTVDTEEAHRVTVIGRRPPALRRTQVLSDVDARLDGTEHEVLDTWKPKWI